MYTVIVFIFYLTLTTLVNNRLHNVIDILFKQLVSG